MKIYWRLKSSLSQSLRRDFRLISQTRNSCVSQDWKVAILAAQNKLTLKGQIIEIQEFKIVLAVSMNSHKFFFLGILWSTWYLKASGSRRVLLEAPNSWWIIRPLWNCKPGNISDFIPKCKHIASMACVGIDVKYQALLFFKINSGQL
jgi:hypothetical protein